MKSFRILQRLGLAALLCMFGFGIAATFSQAQETPAAPLPPAAPAQPGDAATATPPGTNATATPAPTLDASGNPVPPQGNVATTTNLPPDAAPVVTNQPPPVNTVGLYTNGVLPSYPSYYH